MRHLWVVFVLLGSAASAAEVGACFELDRISNLVGQPKTFAEGKIRIAHVDTGGEPVCCSSHLLVFIPSDEIGNQCFAISQRAATGDRSPTGFSNIEFARIKGSYDAKRGLLLSVPYTLYNLDGGKGDRGKPGSTNVRVNLQKGSVTIEP
jgi:hypothetical protein